ncbi:hypothetical protein EDD29_0862 [Actinocorallia herbida]|uniref:Uncharacterized protein n=2 Tax=Actinocorallia herbida TaxID=58109 RepID=A0A3N1CPX4_9ACTN|nr:hypothetical protein EDD29_0862 [Actinocorallia herbida]
MLSGSASARRFSRGRRPCAPAVPLPPRRAGRAVAFFPEGARARDRTRWPMRAKTGAAPPAPETGVPAVPAARRGAHELPPHRLGGRHAPPRETTGAAAGEPVDLTAYADSTPDADTLRAATGEIMRKITVSPGELRDQAPPERPYVHEERRQT